MALFALVFWASLLALVVFTACVVVLFVVAVHAHADRRVERHVERDDDDDDVPPPSATVSTDTTKRERPFSERDLITFTPRARRVFT